MILCVCVDSYGCLIVMLFILQLRNCAWIVACKIVVVDCGLCIVYCEVTSLCG